MAIWKE